MISFYLTILRIGHVKLKDDIYRMNPEESWTDWAVKCFVKTPVIWSFAKVKAALMERDIDDLEYVYISYLKVFTSHLLSAIFIFYIFELIKSSLL